MYNPHFNPEDGLTDKYHVFRAPPSIEPGLKVRASYSGEYNGVSMTGALREIGSFTFVLKPNNDHHARVALAAYAASCSITKPQLARELREMLDQDEWGED